MKTFNEIMKIRDEPDNKPEVTKRKFQVRRKPVRYRREVIDYPIIYR